MYSGIKGSVVLKKNKVDVTAVGALLLDRIYELFGKGISLQLISSRCADHANTRKGTPGKEAYLEDWVSKLTSLNAEDHATYNVTFEWDESLGVPGALIVKNQHHSQLYLKTVTLEDVPGHGPVHFIWVYRAHRYTYNCIFFRNEVKSNINMCFTLQFATNLCDFVSMKLQRKHYVLIRCPWLDIPDGDERRWM
ncbi:Lox9p [Orobanche hederae]